MTATAFEKNAVYLAVKNRPVVVPSGRVWIWPEDGPLMTFIEEARNWPQPMQDALLPLLMANGFRTQAEQDESMKRALLRAAALDTYASGWERREYAHRYGRPNAIRAIWWLRRRFGRDRFEG